MTIMRAIQFAEYGEPSVLEYAEVECPTLQEREVLIEVRSIGVNYSDVTRRRGRSTVLVSLPFVPGSEVAGVVAEVGSRVDRVQVGDRVSALLGGHGSGYAEYVAAQEQLLIPIPPEMDFDYAAAIPLQGLTAYHTLKTFGSVSPGESVLVHAAAGGVGLLAVQMAKLMEAGQVIATASSREKLDLPGSLGADALINYMESDWTEQVLRVTEGNGTNIILEMVGGQFPQKNMRCLAPFGRMIVFGAASGERGSIVPTDLMRHCQTVTGFFLTELLNHPGLYASGLEQVLDWFKTGKVRLTIGGRFPLQQAEEVHNLLESRETVGKLIMNP